MARTPASRALLLLSALAPPICAVSLHAAEPSAVDPSWPDYVAPLIHPAELDLYLGLESAFDKSSFAEAFWASRDPDPSTSANELRSSWPQRRAVAESRFDGLDNDRSRTFMLRGPPRFILADLCPDELWPLEIWVYADDSGRTEDTVVFYSPPDTGRPRQWEPVRETYSALLSLPAAGEKAADSLRDSCRRGEEVLAALQLAVGAAALEPHVDTAWLESFRQSLGHPSDSALDCSLTVHFAGAVERQTIVDGHVSVAADLQTGTALEFEIDGDVFRGERQADHFRYLFTPVASRAAGRVDFHFRRYLPAGSYRLLLTITERASGDSRRIERLITVPPAAANAGPVSGHAAHAESAPSFKILPLPKLLLTGRQRVEVRATDPAVTKVRFFLDDKAVMTKSRPPFSVEVDLGAAPRTHLLEAVGLDGDDREIARDRVPVNVGPHRFSVRLLEPRHHDTYREELTVRAEVDVPAEEKLDRLEVHFNDRRLVTLYQPPFVLPHLEIPVTTDIGYVRTVAVLADGHLAEDLVVVNAPGSVDRLQVDYVELFATVVNRKGETVEGLTLADFTVMEDGERQDLRRLETVRNLSINAVLAVDTSTSMAEKMDEAEEAARRFLSAVVRPQDRAAVILFSDQPELAVTLTNDVGKLTAGLSEIEAAGETTLYDAVVLGLYYLAGLPGKRVLIVLSDGVDSDSRHSFDETLDFARRSGTAIYGIGIGISPRDIEGRHVLRLLARETGGAAFFVDSARSLGRVYERIERELRSQYLIGYQSTRSSTQFRRVELEVAGRGVTARTVPGYYP